MVPRSDGRHLDIMPTLRCRRVLVASCRRPPAGVIRTSEEGVALVAVLLLLGLLSGLGAALAVSATTETLIARNHQVGAQAQAAAEAGLVHGVAVTLDQLHRWSSLGFASPGAAVTAMLRGPDDLAGSVAANTDNGSLESLGLARPPGRVGLAGAPDATYEVRAHDDDDPALGRGLSPADVARIGENGETASDANAVLVIRAIGYAGTMARPDAAGTPGGNAFAGGATGASGALAIVEASIGLRLLPAVVANGALVVRDAARIEGGLGSVHANGDLDLEGSPTVSGNATSSATVRRSGTPVIAGSVADGRDTLPIPPVRAAAYRAQADFVLTAAGVLRALDGTTLCDGSASPTACVDAGYAWVYGGASGWSMPGDVPPPAGTYYVESDVVVTGSPGSLSVPAPLSVIAEGSITVTGSPVLTPETAGLLFVADGDLLVTGALRVTGGGAQLLVREQAHFAGAPMVEGQLLIENDRTASALVTTSAIGGETTISFNGTGGARNFAVTSWRRVTAR